MWKFENEAGADQALETLRGLVQQELIKVQDAAIVTWKQGKKKPKTRQANNLAAAGALGGAFWGMLFGLIFFVPLLGLAIGAATGALSGSLRDIGINDNFIKEVREQVKEGTSALFVMTSDAVVDRVKDAFAGQSPQLIHTNLSSEQEDALRKAFADE